MNKLWITSFLCVLVVTVGTAQDWQLTNPTTVQMRGECSADNDCFGPLPSPDTDSFNANTFVSGGLGYDWALTRGAEVSENTPPGLCQQQATWAQNSIFSRAIIDGVNSDQILIMYGVTSECLAGKDIGYAADGHVLLRMTVTLDIINAPPGYPVIINYSWDHFGGFGGPSEAVDEDSGFSIGSLTLSGRGDLLQGQFNFGHPSRVNGWNKRINQSDTLRRHVGDQIQLTLALNIDTRVLPPWPTPPMYARQDLDRSSASQWGKITLSLGTPIILTPPDTLYASWLEYSVDIGSDAELSDPTTDGNEVYDPGDAYPWNVTLPPGGAPGMFDDANIFAGVDPWPTTPDFGSPPATRAPVGSGISPDVVRNLYFDLDGLDYLDFDLQQFAYGPGLPSIGQFLSPCIFPGEHMFVSFDDDAADHYTNSFSVPMDSPSPWNFDIYGTLARRDEVVGLVVFPFYPGYRVFEYNFLPESGISSSMVPDPDLAEEFDDDVDALDIRDGQCAVAYFSVDHEATRGLDPGIIYVVVPGGYSDAITAVHLGILPGTDIDAFEFAWVFDGTAMRNGLALLFSVDDNDPLTPLDESGGLDPKMIYVSFLNGTFYPYLTLPLSENVDAIACWSSGLFSQYTPPPPGCRPPERLVIRFDPATSVTTLNFHAPNAGVYEIYSTSSINAPFPGPAWLPEVMITALPGQVSWDDPNIAAVNKRYVVIQICP